MGRRGVEFPSREDLRAWAREAEQRLRAAYRAWLESVRREYGGLTADRVKDRIRREVLANPQRGRALYVLAVLAWFSFVVWSRIIVPMATIPYARPDLGFQVIGYFENGAGGLFVDSLPALEERGRLLDAIVPFWYSVAPDGSLVGDGYREEVMRAARVRGLRVVPMVSNLKDGAGNTLDAVRDPEARRRAVQALAALTVERDFDGLNLSFSLLPPEGRDAYSQFVRELAGALHARGRALWVTVFPDVDLPEAVHGFLDYRAIGQAADLVILPAFDRHWTLTDPGPLSPRPWVEASLDSLLRHVPARKVILNIGTHAYDWPVDSRQGITEYLPTYGALERAAAAGAEIRLEPESGQSYFDYRGLAGITRRVWLQDAQHLADKTALARRRGLRGVAVWRLGFSEEGALEELGRALGRGP